MSSVAQEHNIGLQDFLGHLKALIPISLGKLNVPVSLGEKNHLVKRAR